MKLINLFIRTLNNCSLGVDFRGSRHAEENVVVIMEFLDWVQVKKHTTAITLEANSLCGVGISML